MIIGVGLDIEEIKNFRSLSSEFLNLVFTKKELFYCNKKKNPPISLAGRFCAKEAVIKATLKKISMKNIEILRNKSGKPQVYIKNKLNKKIFCSISHNQEIATAIVIIEK